MGVKRGVQKQTVASKAGKSTPKLTGNQPAPGTNAIGTAKPSFAVGFGKSRSSK